MNKFCVYFEENGGEYAGCLIITCEKIYQKNQTTFIADSITIEIDENILEIKEIK